MATRASRGSSDDDLLRKKDEKDQLTVTYELARRAAAGDKEALMELLVNPYFHERLRRICQTIARRRSKRGFPVEIEDVIQEAFKKLLSKISTFKGEGPIDAWINRSMINQGIDDKRKQTIYEKYLETLKPNARSECRGGNIEERDLTRKILQNERKSQLQIAIKKLPLLQQRAVELRMEELTTAEIGEKIGKSNVEVYRLLATALKTLRRMLSSES